VVLTGLTCTNLPGGPLLGPRMADIVIAMKLGDFPMPVDKSVADPCDDVEATTL